MDATSPTCPHCAATLDPSDTAICINCGFFICPRPTRTIGDGEQTSSIDCRAVSDLRIISGESFIDEEGKRCVAIYSLELDAVTFVDDVEEQRLLTEGVIVIESLPDT